jgi:outer membrane protein
MLSNTKNLVVLASLTVLSSVALFAYADNQSPWLIRGELIDVVPSASSSTISGIGGNVTDISSRLAPELDINYFLSPNIALELILATARHSVTATGTTLGTVNLGEASILPPTLTVRYNFFPSAIFDPYLGAGINYTWFYDVNNGPTATSVTYKDNAAPVLQAGCDVNFNSNWSANFDVKKIYLGTTVNVTALGLNMSTHVNINPTIYSIGLGYRF